MANSYPEHTVTPIDQQEAIALVSELPDGTLIFTPRARPLFFPNMAQAPVQPSPEAAPAHQNDIYAVNKSKSLELGAEIHEELQSRLKSGEERYPAFAAIATEMNETTTDIQMYHRYYLGHLKKEKQKHYRAVIIAGKKQKKTDKQIAVELKCNEKTIAKKRREIEAELLQGAT